MATYASYKTLTADNFIDNSITAVKLGAQAGNKYNVKYIYNERGMRCHHCADAGDCCEQANGKCCYWTVPADTSKVTFEILFLKNDPLSAVTSPHYCSRNNFTEIENNNISSNLKQYLQKKNHAIKYKDMTSGLNIIWKKNQFWQGIADPRREGFAVGY